MQHHHTQIEQKWGRKVSSDSKLWLHRQNESIISCISIKNFSTWFFQHSLASPSTKPNSIYFWKLKIISDLTDVCQTQHLQNHFILNFFRKGILTHAPKNECEVQEQCRAPPSGVPFCSYSAYILDGDPKEYGEPINKHFQEGNQVVIMCFNHNMKQFDCLKLNS